MYKKIIAFVFFVLCAFLLASCNNDGATVELKTMSMFGGTDPHAETYESLLAAFEEEHKVKINDSSATSDEIWKNSVISAFYVGNDPDVLFYFTGATAKPLVDNKKVVSVTDIRKVYPDYAKNISASVLDPYAVPFKGFVEGVFVNTEFFTGDLAPYLEKDVWTWEDYHQICAKLIAKNVVPFALGANDVPHYWIEHLVLGTLGPEAFQDIEDSITNHQDKWVEALMHLHDFAELGWFGPTKGNQLHAIADAAFKSGDAAMILDGSWLAGSFSEETEVKASKLKMMPFPAIPTSEGGKNTVYMQSGFTSGFYISKKAWDDPAKRDLCVKLVEKMTNTASIATFITKTGGIPADASVQISNQNNLHISMNSMSSRIQVAVLPLSDVAKAGTFIELVQGANDYLTGNETGIIAALQDFVNLQ
jgi:raffinose/stachyose/melibiose transport system substrate-binding protein